MTKWLGPLAYFGAVFGVEGEAQPGVMSVVASGLGGCTALIEGAARAGFTAQGTSGFQGTLETAQQAQAVDIGMVTGGSGSVVAALSANTTDAPVARPGSAYRSNGTTPILRSSVRDIEVITQGAGHMVAMATAFGDLGVVASGAGSMCGSPCASEPAEGLSSEDLALILALAA